MTKFFCPLQCAFVRGKVEMKAWSQQLEKSKIEHEGSLPPLHDWCDGDVGDISVFDGPSCRLNQMCTETSGRQDGAHKGSDDLVTTKPVHRTIWSRTGTNSDS